jgi:hypothetical protein
MRATPFLLSFPKHNTHTAGCFKGKKNGELLRAAHDAYDVLLTVCQLMSDEDVPAKFSLLRHARLAVRPMLDQVVHHRRTNTVRRLQCR